MPKNIILCSDGTGNSGGKDNNTNVWRLFLAVNHQPPNAPEQVAFYDDGVGSQDYKILKAIGGAFGWGISENLRQLYGFLMLNYQPGDKIYLFGFSRGAFTIRTLANMIRYCGIAECDSLSVRGIDDVAAQALYAYKHRLAEHTAGIDADGGPVLKKFKEDRGRLNGAPKPTKDIPIEFVGVWDTVEALGLPIDEMKHGLDHWFGLQFREQENDLHPGIRHAYQALAIDEERLTFHPLLWNEALKSDDQTVEQVWFPGVHANVGGGYAKDQMSLVALNWLMEKADAHGLKFHPTLWAEYQRDQDENGQMYDPRAGLGMYYRYGPRDIRRIAEAANAVVRIHASALFRIKHATDVYAPTGLPETYQVEPAGTGPTEANPHKRHKQLKIVRDLTWWRRALYYLMLIWTLGLAAFCIVFQDSEPTPDFGEWDAGTRALYYIEKPIIDLVALAVPDLATPLLNALRQYPYAMVVFVPPFAFFFWFNWRLVNRTRALSVRAWHMSLATNPAKIPHDVSPRTWWIKLARWFRDNGVIHKLVKCWHKALRLVAPKITVAAAFLAGVAFLAYGGSKVTMWTSLSMNPAQEESIILDENNLYTEFTFDTRNSMQATPVWLEADMDYQIKVTVVDNWSDNGKATTPAGIPHKDEFPNQTRFPWTRRDPTKPWFVLMGAIGGNPPFAIGKGPKSIHPSHPGRLYLYVNDAFGAYHNNLGTATIRVSLIGDAD